jgi:hypothetical protein
MNRQRAAVLFAKMEELYGFVITSKFLSMLLQVFVCI